MHPENITKEQTKRIWYINYITILFTAVSGIKTLDSMCLTYMSETVIEQLSITVGQYSKLSSYFYLSYSTSCILVGYITSRMSKKKEPDSSNDPVAGYHLLAMSFVTSYMGLPCADWL